MKKKKIGIVVVLFVLIAIFAVIAIFLIKKYKPSNKEMSLKQYYKVSEGQIPVILQDKIYEQTAIEDAGEIYVDYDLVKQYLNSRFYWDSTENLLLYTTSNSLISVAVGSKDYYINKSKSSENYSVVKVQDNKAYVALDFVKKYSAFEYKMYQNPERLVINYRFEEKQDYAKAEKKARLRFSPSIKSDILVKLKKDEPLMILEQLADSQEKGKEEQGNFDRAMTESGVIGYVRKKDLGKIYQSEFHTDFQPEQYPHILSDQKICLAWHQVTNASANDGILNLLSAAKGVNVIAPTWFTVSGNEGEITSLASDTYVSRARSLDVDVWAVCNDFGHDSKIGKVLCRTSTRQKLAKNLIAEAIRYSLDGINIDFEYVKKENGEDFVQFIRELGIMCRNNGIVLSIDNYPPTDYSAYYNRTEQAAVADYVITMAYDEYFAGSEEPGPVSSLSYVQNSTENTLAQVPGEQTIIALPFYSRLWKETTDGEKAKVSSEAYSMKYASQVLSDAGVTATWDDATGMNYGEYKKDGAQYKIWVEDKKSLEEKMKVAQTKKTAGLAFWKLGLEDSSIWDVVDKYLK